MTTEEIKKYPINKPAKSKVTKKCLCGCGEYVKLYRHDYIFGHWMKNNKHSKGKTPDTTVYKRLLKLAGGKNE